MRVLALSHLYPPQHLGGYEVLCQAVMARLARRGHQVTVLTSVGELFADAPEAADGVEVRRELRLWLDMQQMAPWTPRPVTRLRQEWSNQRSFRSAVRDLRPDVVSIWSMGFMSFALLTLAERMGLPAAMWVANDGMFEANVYDAWTRTFADRPRAARLSAAIGVEARLPALDTLDVSFISRFTRDRAAGKGRWRYPEADVVYPGIDGSAFVSTIRGRPWGWRVLYVGRVVPDKGVGTVVEALAKLPSDATLVVDGRASPTHLAELRALADRLGVGSRVIFQNSRRSDLPAVYHSADVVVFPSRWEEPFGLVPLEAMAAGLPVVASATGGSREYLRDGDNCLGFPPGDAAALAGQLRRLAEDKGLRRRLTESGTATVARFDIERFAADIESRLVAVASRAVR